MKEIERSSAAWNPSPSSRVTLIDSALAVLKSSLGTRWPLFLFFLLLVMIGPSLFCRFVLNDVTLDPPLFVTEWLHLSIEGVFFFFILEIVRHRSLSSTARQSLHDFVSWNYVIPLERLIPSLKRSREPLERKESLDTLTSASDDWTIIRHALSDEALNRLPNDSALPVWILSHRAALDPTRCTALLNSLNSGSLKPQEFDELLGRLQKLLTSAERLCKETSWA
jgi:hypothetical protein